jgi:MtrB/PioB family decaheme-associated outer membrane protein
MDPAMNQKPVYFPPRPLQMAVLAALTAYAFAAAPPAPAAENRHWGYWPAADTSEWVCNNCPDAQATEAEVQIGLGYSDTGSARLARHTGITSEGPYLLAGGQLRAVNPQGRLIELSAANLGLDTRSISLRAGERDRYRIRLAYASIPGFVAESPRTVFQGLGSNTLTLPEDWIRAAQTSDLSQLDANLRPVKLDRRQETLDAGLKLFPNRSLEYGLHYRRMQEDGMRIHRGSFLTFSAELPTNLDRVTDQIDAHATYRNRSWTATASYHLSVFRNAADSITWDNPFSIGPEQGRMALEPDNRFHQFMLHGSWRPRPQLTTSGRITFGRMEQNAAFAPATINPALLPVALPRSSLDGQVDTLSGNLRAVLTVSPRMTLTGEGYYNDHDNRTERHTYTQIVMDTLSGIDRINRPYSHERLGGRAFVDFRVNPETRLSVGGQAERFKRTLQEVDQTEITAAWAEIRNQVSDQLEAQLRVSRERRILAAPYAAPADVSWLENPLLRKYHLADRNRDQLHTRLAYAFSERLSIGLSADIARDEFPYSRVGLTEAREHSYILDLSAAPRENIAVSAFLGRETIESQLNGASSFAAPNWTAHMKDRIDSLGFTVQANDVVRAGLDIGLDVLFFSGKGNVRMETGSPTPELPALTVRQQTLQWFGRYRFSEQLSMRLDYRYDRFRSRDYALDAVGPATVPEVLTLGQTSPDYTAHFIGGSLVYRF